MCLTKPLSAPLFNRLQPPTSICILRLSAIGDVTHVLAVVQEIARFYPQCKITWIVGKVEYALLSQIMDLSQIQLVIYDKKAGWKGIFTVWKQLKDQKFDALLNMQTALRASILSLGIKAKYKIGFGKKRCREGQQFFVNERVQDPENPHVLEGFKAFAYKIGVTEFTPQWQLTLSEQTRLKAKAFLNLNKKNIIISPCSSKQEKDWLPERYAAVAQVLVQQGHNVILCGSPSQREIKTCENITALSKVAITNACGKTNLSELTALIAQAELIISPDSGPAHIATMVNTPVIGLYAYHNPLRTAPFNNLGNVISVYEKNVQQEFGKPSNQLPWATKLKGKNLMAQIEVEQVLSEVKKFL